jgi:hypothetical protein
MQIDRTHSTLRYHRAAECFLEGGYEFVLRLDGEIKPVVLLGEALRGDN